MKKIVILYSGGLDSYLMYRYAIHTHKSIQTQIQCVHFDIGQPNAHKEFAAMNKLGVPYTHFDITSPSLKLDPVSKEGSASSSIFIPGRNAMFVQMAATTLYPMDEIWLGALEGETHDNATDKNETFCEHMNTLLDYVFSPFPIVPKLVYPFYNGNVSYSKADILQKAVVNWGVEESEILQTSSCLAKDADTINKPCGECVVCVRRWGIFSDAGIKEEYVIDPWDSLKALGVMKATLENKSYPSSRYKEIIYGVRNTVDTSATTIVGIVRQRIKILEAQSA